MRKLIYLEKRDACCFLPMQQQHESTSLVGKRTHCDETTNNFVMCANNSELTGTIYGTRIPTLQLCASTDDSNYT